MNVEEAIRTRRTITKFKPYKMPREKLFKILEAARLAPSAANAQPWRFIVVEDDAIKRKLAEITARSLLAEASVVVAVLGNAELAGSGGGTPSREWLGFDIGIAVEHIVLQATELGLASCWHVPYHELEVKRILDVPEKLLPGGWKVMALLPIGLAGEMPPPQDRKSLEQLVYLNRFGNSYPKEFYLIGVITSESAISREVLLEIVVSTERGIQGFYKTLADKFPDYANTFLDLAEDEGRHADAYSELLKRPKSLSPEDVREKAESYIRTLRGLGFLTPLSADVSKAEDLKSAVELAVKLEKDALLFYHNLLMYLDEEDRKIIYKIIDVEYIHLTQLSRILS